MRNEPLNILGGKVRLSPDRPDAVTHAPLNRKSRDDSKIGTANPATGRACVAAFPAEIFNTSLVKLNTVHGVARRLSACPQFVPVVFSSASVKFPFSR